MDLVRHYLGVVRRWWWLVILGTALGAGGAFLLSQRMTPTYQASTLLLVQQVENPSAPTYQDVLASQRSVATFVQRLTSRDVLAATANDLKLEEGAEGLGRQVSATAIRDTSLIRLTVRDSDPNRAMQIANRLPEVFLAHNQALQAKQYADQKASLNDQLQSLQSDISRLQQEIKTAEQQTTGTGNDQATLDQKRAILASLRSTYANLLNKLNDIQLAEASALGGIQVDQQASLPHRPVSPDVQKNTILGGLAGLVLAMTIAVLLSYADDTVRTRDELAATLSVPNLGTVPDFRSMNGAFNPAAATAAGSSAAEPYRFLQTNIQLAAATQGFKTFLIVSPTESQDTSRVTASLATTIARSGRAVIAVDADLERPSLHAIFGTPEKPGVAELTSARGNAAGPLAAYVRPTAVPNLSIVPAGEPAGDAAWTLDGLRELLAQLRARADVVLIDGPALLERADGPALAHEADAVVLVADAGRSRRRDLTEAWSLLQRAGACVLGTVLTSGDGLQLAPRSDHGRRGASPTNG